MSRRVTAKMIADELGVSVMTVSRALNNRPNVDEKTRELIVNMAQKLGYIPNHVAKSLVLKKTHTIGVVVPEISISFFPDVIKAIEETAYGAGYQIILTHSSESMERETYAIQTLASKRVDGMLLCTAADVKSYEFYKQIIRSGLPVVFYDRCAFGVGASCVRINDEQSAETITNHLIKHGYKKIAHLASLNSLSVGQSRFTGFKKAMQESHLPLIDDLIVEAGFDEAGGYKAMLQILNYSREEYPNAVMTVNDPVAFGAMQAILERGLRVPEDIAIVGIVDDIRAELMPSPLTTIRQPAHDLGVRALQKLLAHIENKNEPVEDIVIDTEIVIRESCGCFNRGKKIDGAS
ncbi:MAG: substrate-binding domain-containing protein [Caldithrix sp.]|nr:substrate-binding domain-containing protein [Caldithrix sp.]